MLDFEKLDYEDDSVWDLISSGKTVGIFQLESHLGREWASKVKPRNIRELADLVSIIRPGTLEAKENNKTMTEIYAERKHGRMPIVPIHPILTDILKDTYQIIVYQEQAMAIANKVAGFSLEETDSSIRKGIGKKDAALLFSIRKRFVEGCSKTSGLSEEDGNLIFDIIEKSSRYSFNLSHAVEYAHITYATAYKKVHRTIEFFRDWMSDSKHRLNGKLELRQLIHDTKNFGIKVKGPDISSIQKDFYIKDNNVYYGLTNIKGIGPSSADEVLGVLNFLPKSIDSYSWFELLSKVLDKFDSSVVTGLISSGAIPGSRKMMLYEYSMWQNLTDRERAWIVGKNNSPSFTSLEIAMESLLNSGYITGRRVQKMVNFLQLLRNPPHSLEDSNDWIISTEENILGTTVSIDRLQQTRIPDTSCKDLASGIFANSATIGVEIQRIKEFVIKSGKNVGNKMAFIGVTDGTEVDCIAFTDVWNDYGYMLYEGNCVALTVSRSNRGGFIIEKVYQL